MSRVRVYELATEFGIPPKDLAVKLQEKGFDVKGHSSTVDVETARSIRKMFSTESKSEQGETKVSGNSSSTVTRRKSTIIRRRPKAEDVSPQTGEEASHAGGGEIADSTRPVEKTIQAEAVPAKSEKSGPAADSSEGTQPEKDGGMSVSAPGQNVADAGLEAPSASEEIDAVQHTADAGETVDTETVSDALAPEKKSEPLKDAGAPQAAEEKKVRREPVRRTFAKVVGTIDIPVEKKPEKTSSTQRTARKRGTSRDSVPAPSAFPEPAGADNDYSKGKKKSRKSDGYSDDDTDRKRGVKKSSKRAVKFTHFNDDDLQGGGRRGKRGRAKKETRPAPVTEMKASKKRIVVYETITVADLAMRMRVKASEVIAKLMGLGVMATINQSVDVETAMLIATDFGYEVEQGVTDEIGIQMLDEEEQTGGEALPRPPVVTVMGHVDHGKTSILDAIRKTDVALGEAGGITQHIGAYHVQSAIGNVTFVDTPGHAAFTEMRARGAQVTDLVILVVAADDGVMDQTREAIRHAQAGSVPIIVCVNKIDKDNADPDRVKRELSELDLVPEEWGGQTIYCETSAKKNIGIDTLLENIQLMAEMLELKADPNRKAKGRVIEAKLDKGRGAVATIMVQEGTLHNGDFFVAGIYSGKVRAMLDDKGRKLKEAGPSVPVEVQGLSGVPSAGDEFIVVTDEKMAKSVSHSRSLKARESELGANSKISLDKLFEQMNEGEVKELNVVLRADVQGTLEAFAKSAEELSTDEIRVKILHEGTGTITESDILLASASDAIIIGFNVRPTAKVKEMAQKENIDIRAYDVIYHALDDIRKAMAGMLDPTFEEDVIGNAEVRDTFSVPKVGTIAGCSVTEGKVVRNARVRLIREGVVIYTGKISSLRRFKDDVKEVLTGFECGIGIENYNDLKVEDQLEVFLLKEVEATI